MADFNNPIAISSSSGVKSQNAEFFPSYLHPNNVKVNGATIFFVSFSLNLSVELEVTRDSGNSWSKLRDQQGSTTFTADNDYTIPIFVRQGDDINFRIPTSGGAVLYHFRVDQLIS